MTRASLALSICFAGFAGGYEIINPSAILNLNFEERTQDGIPMNWYTGGGFDTVSGQFLSDSAAGFSVTLDSITHYHGKYSLLLETLPGGTWGSAREDCIEYFDTLLKYLRGKRVTYSGWIKTQNVSDWAGLWWRVDGANGVIATNDSRERAIKGTRNWKKYSFTIPISDSAVTFDFGVWLASSYHGKAWFDNLTIDTNGIPFAR